MEFSSTMAQVDRVNNDLQEFHSNDRRTPGEPSVWGACPGSTGGLCQTDHGYSALVSNKLYASLLVRS